MSWYGSAWGVSWLGSWGDSWGPLHEVEEHGGGGGASEEPRKKKPLPKASRDEKDVLEMLTLILSAGVLNVH